MPVRSPTDCSSFSSFLSAYFSDLFVSDYKDEFMHAAEILKQKREPIRK